MTDTASYRIIRKPEVLNLLGFSKSTLHLRINEGLLPPPISLGQRASGYIEHEVQAVLKAMIAGQSQEQIKQLVIELTEARKKLGGIAA